VIRMTARSTLNRALATAVVVAFALLTQPKDQGKFDALVAKANAKKSGSIVSEKVGDWTVLSDKQASIDAYKTRASGKKLSDDATFKTAMGELSGDALAKAYVNGPQVQQALQSRAGAAAQGTFGWAVAELVAQDDGVKLDGTFKGQPLKGVQEAAAYAPKLLGSVPSGALVVLDFKGGSSLNSLDSAAGANVPQLQGAMGFIRQLTPIFKNETVLSVSPGTPFPAVTLIAEPSNAQQAVAGIDQLVPANQTENLRPLTSFIAYGTSGSGTGKFTAFLQIK